VPMVMIYVHIYIYIYMTSRNCVYVRAPYSRTIDPVVEILVRTLCHSAR